MKVPSAATAGSPARLLSAGSLLACSLRRHHASGCPELLAASAKQPLGAALPALFSTWVRAELLLQLEGELGLLDGAPRLNRRADVAQDRVPLAHRQSHLSVRCETDAERCNAGAPGAKLALMGPERRRSGVRVVRMEPSATRGASVEPECMAPFWLGNARPRRPGPGTNKVALFGARAVAHSSSSGTLLGAGSCTGGASSATTAPQRGERCCGTTARSPIGRSASVP